MTYTYREVINYLIKSSNFKGTKKMIYIDTFRKKRIDPFNPDPSQIVIEDIAHALAMLCRFGGHCSSFYSVAEHSINVSKIVDKEFAKWGLLHDATEAYIGDVVRPIKHLSEMIAYRDAEDRLNNSIAEKFGLSKKMPKEVKVADGVMLQTEKSQILLGADLSTNNFPVVDLALDLYSPIKAKKAFLKRFNELFTI